MTENEAINILENIYEKYVRDCGSEKEYMKQNFAITEAVKALSEIQQYRAVGTVGEIKELKENNLSIRELKNIYATCQILKKYQEIGTVDECRVYKRIAAKEFVSVCLDAKIMDELREYKNIGTARECWEARKKQRGKKTGRPYMNGYGNTKAECPGCHCTVIYPSNYCKFCGQKLEWAE